MAYGIHFGAVPLSQISAYQAHEIGQLTPSHQATGSHILPDVVEDASLRELFLEAFDGGEVLRSDLWHPCRVPRFHRADQIAKLAPVMATKFGEMLSELDAELAASYRAELGDVVSLFSVASAANLCVVTTLGLPFDRKRAVKVTLPFPCEPPDFF